MSLIACERVIEVVQKCFESTTIDMDSSLGSVKDWDSVKQLFILMEVEREFNISIPESRLTELTSLVSIVDYLNSEQDLKI